VEIPTVSDNITASSAISDITIKYDVDVVDDSNNFSSNISENNIVTSTERTDGTISITVTDSAADNVYKTVRNRIVWKAIDTGGNSSTTDTTTTLIATYTYDTADPEFISVDGTSTVPQNLASVNHTWGSTSRNITMIAPSATDNFGVTIQKWRKGSSGYTTYDGSTDWTSFTDGEEINFDIESNIDATVTETVTWYIADAAGNDVFAYTTATVVFQVSDNEAPTFSGVPSTQTRNPGYGPTSLNVEITPPTATDNRTAAGNIILEYKIDSGGWISFTNNGASIFVPVSAEAGRTDDHAVEHTVTWKATDITGRDADGTVDRNSVTDTTDIVVNFTLVFVPSDAIESNSGTPKKWHYDVRHGYASYAQLYATLGSSYAYVESDRGSGSTTAWLNTFFGNSADNPQGTLAVAFNQPINGVSSLDYKWLWTTESTSGTNSDGAGIAFRKSSGVAKVRTYIKGNYSEWAQVAYNTGTYIFVLSWKTSGGNCTFKYGLDAWGQSDWQTDYAGGAVPALGYNIAGASGSITVTANQGRSAMNNNLYIAPDGVGNQTCYALASKAPCW
tara:strand:- start:145 stop:1830 length:1686 start_codon:yes stop_codon:yes gene_type:complete